MRIFPVVKNTVWPIRPLIRISTSKEKIVLVFPPFVCRDFAKVNESERLDSSAEVRIQGF